MDVKMLNVDPEIGEPNKKARRPKLGFHNVSEGLDLPEDIRKIYLPDEVDAWRSLKMLEEYGGDLSDIEEEEYTEVDVDELNNFVYMDPDIYMEEDEKECDDTVDDTNMTKTCKRDETSTELRRDFDGGEKPEHILRNIVEKTHEKEVGKTIVKDDNENGFEEETTKYQTYTEAKIKDESIKSQIQNEETLIETKKETLGAGDRKREKFDEGQIQQTVQMKIDYNKAKYMQENMDVGDYIGNCNRTLVYKDRNISKRKESEIKETVKPDQNIQKFTDEAALKKNHEDDEDVENMEVYIRLMASPKMMDGFRSKVELTKDIYSTKGVVDGECYAKVEYYDEVHEVSSSSSSESNLEENVVNKDEEKKRTTSKWRRFLRLIGVK